MGFGTFATRRTLCFLFCPILLGGALFLSFSLSCSRPPLPSEEISQCLYTSDGKYSLREVVASALSKSTRSIFLSTYALSDPLILELLNAQARKGRKVTIHVDHNTSKSLVKKLDSSIVLIRPKRRGLMHEKILCIDESYLLLGSANMTYSSLMLHDNMILGVYDKDLAQKLIEQWDTRGQTLHGIEGELVLLPDRYNTQIEKLKNYILSAKIQTTVAQFTFTHSLLSHTLEQLRKRGVPVTCFLDTHAVNGVGRGIVKKLREAQCRLFRPLGKQLLHHKWVLIDEDTLVIGSANWTQSAFQKNYDFYFIIKINEFNKKTINKYINKLNKTSFRVE